MRTVTESNGRCLSSRTANCPPPLRLVSACPPRQPVGLSLSYLEVVGDLPDGNDGVVSWAGWHGLGQMDGIKRQHSAKFSFFG